MVIRKGSKEGEKSNFKSYFLIKFQFYFENSFCFQIKSKLLENQKPNQMFPPNYFLFNFQLDTEYII